MRPETAIKALDKKLQSLQSPEQLQRPHGGWIRAVREALGMTSAQLAERLGVSRPRVTNLEKAEVAETVTLATLRRAAAALDCTLVYAFVPGDSFQQVIEDRARLVAKRLIGTVDHTMALEGQHLSAAELEEEIENLAGELIRKNRKTLWKD